MKKIIFSFFIPLAILAVVVSIMPTGAQAQSTIATSSSVGQATISLSQASPEISAYPVTDSANGEYDKLTTLVFDVRAQSESISLKNLDIQINPTTAGSKGTIKTAYLYDGSTLVSSATISNLTAKFQNISAVIPAHTTKMYTIKVDVTGVIVGSKYGFNVSTKGLSYTESYTGTNGPLLNAIGSATGNPITIFNYSSFPEVTLLSKSITTFNNPATFSSNPGINNPTTTIVASFDLKIKAVGGDVLLVASPRPSPFTFKVYMDGAVIIPNLSSNVFFSAPNGRLVTNGMFTIKEGETVALPVTYQLMGNASYIKAGTYAITLDSIQWQTVKGEIGTITGKPDWRTSSVNVYGWGMEPVIGGILSVVPSPANTSSGSTTVLQLSNHSNALSSELRMSCPAGTSAIWLYSSASAWLDGNTNRVFPGKDICSKLVKFDLPVSAVSLMVINETKKAQNLVPNYYEYLPENPNYARGVSSQITVQATTTSSIAPVTISTSPASPTASTVNVMDSASGRYDGLTALVFNINAPSGDITLKNLGIKIGQTIQPKEVVKKAYLYDGSTLISSASVSNQIATFKNISAVIPAYTTKMYTVKIDVAGVSAGSSYGLFVYTEGLSIVDRDGMPVSYRGSAFGNEVIVTNYASFPEVALLSKSITSFNNPANINNPTTTLSANFELKIRAVDGDILLASPASSSFKFKIYRNKTLINPNPRIRSAIDYSVPNGRPVSNGMFTLHEGETVIIPVTYKLMGDYKYVKDGGYAIGLDSVKWQTTKGEIGIVAGKPDWITNREDWYGLDINPDLSIDVNVLSKSITSFNNPATNNNPTTTISATFNLDIKAINGDIAFAASPRFPGIFKFNIQRDGSLINPDNNLSSAVDFSAPPGYLVRDGRYIIKEGDHVVIPVTYKIMGDYKYIKGGTYVIGLESIMWLTLDGNMNQFAGKPDWKTTEVAVHGLGMEPVKVKPSSVKPSFFSRMRTSFSTAVTAVREVFTGSSNKTVTPSVPEQTPSNTVKNTVESSPSVKPTIAPIVCTTGYYWNGSNCIWRATSTPKPTNSPYYGNPINTSSPRPSSSVTNPTPTPSATYYATPSATYAPTPTYSPTYSPSLSPTYAPTPTYTASPSVTPSPTYYYSATPSPTATPTLTPTPTVTSSPSPSPSGSPSAMVDQVSLNASIWDAIAEYFRSQR